MWLKEKDAGFGFVKNSDGEVLHIIAQGSSLTVGILWVWVWEAQW